MDAEAASPGLLAYYRQRVDAFEVERDDLLKRLAACSTDAAERHALRCETQKRAQEVRDCQIALSAAHAQLFEERDRLLRLQAENDELKLREAEQKQHMQHLLALTEPVGQEVLLARADDPSTGMLYPRHLPLEGGKRVPKSKERARGNAADRGPSHRILRTVYLPSANAEALQLKITSLEAQMAEQLQLASERVEALMQDRRLREQDEEAHLQNYQQQLETLTTKVRRLEEALRSATTDYILARRDRQVAEERAALAETALAQERIGSEQQIAGLRQHHEQRLTEVSSEADTALENERQRAARAVKARDLEANQAATLHASVKAQLEGRVEELEGKLHTAQMRLRTNGTRRSREAEGVAADIALLRKQVSAVERKLTAMRLQARLEDDERLDMLLKKVASKGPAPPPFKPKKLTHLKGQRELTSEAEDLDVIKQNLGALERKVHQGGVLKPVNKGF